jgi:hypothetical protein
MHIIKLLFYSNHMFFGRRNHTKEPWEREVHWGPSESNLVNTFYYHTSIPVPVITRTLLTASKDLNLLALEQNRLIYLMSDR